MAYKKNKARKNPPFTMLFRETSKSPAYRQLSFGARALFIALCGHCFENNGHVYLSQRDAGEELGHKRFNDIANWFRELVHYGFIVQTEARSLGVDGKGKAPHWRITDRPTKNASGQLDTATRDFLHWDGTVFEPHVRPSRRWDSGKATALKKQNPPRHVRSAPCDTPVAEVCDTSVAACDESATDVTYISAARGATDVTHISSIATRVAGAGSTFTPSGRAASEARSQSAVASEQPDPDLTTALAKLKAAVGRGAAA